MQFFVDAVPAVAKLESLTKRLRDRVRGSVEDGAARLVALVRTRLSGEVLAARSGALRDSIGVETNDTGARVFSDGSVSYARIQEYGGRIEIPETVPMKGKALAFAYDGRLVFAAHAAAHAVTIPERSYMRASLAEFAPAFLDTIRKIAAEGPG